MVQVRAHKRGIAAIDEDEISGEVMDNTYGMTYAQAKRHVEKEVGGRVRDSTMERLMESEDQGICENCHKLWDRDDLAEGKVMGKEGRFCYECRGVPHPDYSTM